MYGCIFISVIAANLTSKTALPLLHLFHLWHSSSCVRGLLSTHLLKRLAKRAHSFESPRWVCSAPAACLHHCVTAWKSSAGLCLLSQRAHRCLHNVPQKYNFHCIVYWFGTVTHNLNFLLYFILFSVLLNWTFYIPAIKKME